MTIFISELFLRFQFFVSDYHRNEKLWTLQIAKRRRYFSKSKRSHAKGNCPEKVYCNMRITEREAFGR